MEKGIVTQEKYYYEKNISVVVVYGTKDEYKNFILRDIGIYKVKFHYHKNPILFYLWFLPVKRVINTLLVTKMMIIKLCHCV